MKKNKVAFISGITGMVGSHLADYIMNNSDWDIVGLIRWRSPLDNISHLLDDINNNKRIKDIFTKVLRGHIAVASYKLKNNTCQIGIKRQKLVD